MAPYGEEQERNICKRLQDVWTTIDRSASALSSAWDDIATYCRKDVDITRRLYLHGLEHGFLLFSNKAGSRVRVAVDFKRR